MNFAYAEEATKKIATNAVNLNAWDAIMHASIIVQFTLIALVLMSVVCWAITINKSKTFKQLHASNEPFLDIFWRASSLDDIFKAVPDHPSSSLARVFKAGYLELKKIADSNLSEESTSAPLLSGIDNLERSLRKAADSEIARMENRLTWLATTGSTGPFIGLFGTVWGIMGSFQQIGATKMASLAVVAPGISEALVATAIGLAAAIPATIAYNQFLTKIRRSELEMNNFIVDFLNIAKRNFFTN